MPCVCPCSWSTERRSLGSASAEALHGLWRWRRSIVISMHVCVGIDGRKTWTPSVLGSSVGRRGAVAVAWLWWGLEQHSVSLPSFFLGFPWCSYLAITSAVWLWGRRRAVVAVTRPWGWGGLGWVTTVSSLRPGESCQWSNGFDGQKLDVRILLRRRRTVVLGRWTIVVILRGIAAMSWPPP